MCVGFACFFSVCVQREEKRGNGFEEKERILYSQIDRLRQRAPGRKEIVMKQGNRWSVMATVKSPKKKSNSKGRSST